MYELISLTDNHEITLKDQQITIIGYDQLLKELDELGNYLTSIEVTEENLAKNKKLVSEVRKAANALNAEKIAFKKGYLKPLETLENQVKEVMRRSNSYEETVRRQIRLIEEEEREQKQEEIRKLFNKRLRAYGGKEVSTIYSFDDFFDPKYANKSYPWNKVEQNMVDFFEQRKQDVGALVSFADKTDLNRNTVVTKYLENGDVSTTINYFNSLEEEKEEVKKALEKQKHKPKEKPPEPSMYFKVKESDFARVCELLSLGNVEYEVVDLD